MRASAAQSMIVPLRRVAVRRPVAALATADPVRWHYAGPPGLDTAQVEHGLAVAVVTPSAESDAVSWPDVELPSEIGSHPLLDELEPTIVDHIIATGGEQHVPAGWVVVEELAAGNELYLALDGAISVSAAGQEVARLAAGDFFGEMAAVDWGAGYGAPRMATVIAADDCRLFTIPATVLNRAMRSSPALRRRIERTAAIRRTELGSAVGDPSA